MLTFSNSCGILYFDSVRERLAHFFPKGGECMRIIHGLLDILEFIALLIVFAYLWITDIFIGGFESGD